MKLGKVWAIILLVLVALTSFVSCENEISVEQAGTASISFAPAINKALNQKGEENTAVTTDVSSYYWSYYCSVDAPTRAADDSSFKNLEWQDFADPSGENGKGLGKINNLIKGENYYFGLRGFSDSAKQNLVWEGFHYSLAGDTQTDNFEAVKLTSKTQLITIDVYTAGVGKLYFNFTAPAVNGFGIDDSESSAAFKLNGEVQYDYFTYTLSSLDGSNATSGTNLYVYGDTTHYGYYTSDTDEFTYSDISGDGTELAAGTYLLTIWQNSFDKDATDSENPYGQYSKVSQRKQVLILNIVPGLNTVVSGSLDSTALQTIDYDANLALEVIFHKSDASKVAPLKVTVTNSAGEKKVVYTNDRVKVKNGEFVYLKWTSNTDVNIFVNGDLIDIKGTRRSTRDDFGTAISFYERAESTAFTYLTDVYLAPADQECTIKAYGKAGTDYIVTIESIAEDIEDSESMSFTIVGFDDSAAVQAKNTTAFTEADLLTTGTDLENTVTIKTETDANIQVEATVMKTVAEEILNKTVEAANINKSATTTDNEVVITLSVLESEKTETSVEYEISMKADATVTTSGKTYTNSMDIEEPLSDYVTATIQLDKGLANVNVKHSDKQMAKCDSYANLTAETPVVAEDYSSYVDNGYFFYDAESGKLYIKTKSFSPFKVEFTAPEAKIGNTSYGTLASAFVNVKDGETITMVKNVSTERIDLDATDYNKSFTLDLNGYTLTSSSSYKVVFCVKNGKTLTIDGTTSGSKIEGTIMINKVASNVIINGGTYENDSYCPFYINGSCPSGSNLTINDATIKDNQNSEGLALYLAGPSTTVLTNCTISGGTGLEVRAGNVTLNNCTVNGTDSFAAAANGNGSTVSGAAVAVSQHDPDNVVSVTINGGTYQGEYALYEKDLQNETARNLITLNVTAGTFTGNVYSENCVSFISGGVFSVNPTTYLATGYAAEANTPSANHWKVVEKELHVGTGTKSDPFLIYDKEDFQAITEKYDTYYYYKIADEYTETDLTGWVPVSLNGSFDGNGKSFTNLTACLFQNVGKGLYVGETKSGVISKDITLKNFSATMNVSAPQQYGAASLVKNIFNGGTTTFDSVDVHGKIEGYWNLGSFYNYGPANWDDVGCDYTVNFVNCKSDATLICTSGNTCGGFLGHGYEGSNHTQTLNIDADSAYTGYIYTTGGNAGHYIAMNSTGRLVFNGVETSRYDAAFTSYDRNVAITSVSPIKGDNGFTVAAQNGVARILVSVTAQLDAYDSNNTKIQNLSGITMTFGSSTITENLTGDVKVLDKVTSVTIENNADSYDHSVSGGVMTLNIASDANYKSGTVRITVTQYDADNNILCCGTANVYSITNN